MEGFVKEEEGAETSTQKYNDSLCIQHPAEMERFFQLLVQLSKNVFVMINRTTWEFSFAAVTVKKKNYVGMGKLQKYLHFKIPSWKTLMTLWCNNL